VAVELLNMDCMDYMRECEDNAFDLAIVDPPYGVDRFKKSGSFLNLYGSPGIWNNGVPTSSYFNEIQRIACKVIVWGGNYFDLPKTGGWVFWDKGKNKGDNANFGEGELAWTNFLKTIQIAPIRYDGFVGADIIRIHPTQKPVKLYDWLLTNYAKEGDRILDTHLGSGSSAIAAHYFGCDFVGMEIDKDYYDAAVKRFEAETAQIDLFG